MLGSRPRGGGPQIAEMNLNPVIASPLGAVAVDVRIRLMPWRRHTETEFRRLC
jgi:hypothetical protein